MEGRGMVPIRRSRGEVLTKGVGGRGTLGRRDAGLGSKGECWGFIEIPRITQSKRGVSCTAVLVDFHGEILGAERIKRGVTMIHHRAITVTHYAQN